MSTGIIGALVFRTEDAPDYIPGLITCFSAAGATILSVAATSVHMYTQNRRQAQGKVVLESIEGFRYTL